MYCETIKKLPFRVVYEFIPGEYGGDPIPLAFEEGNLAPAFNVVFYVSAFRIP